MILLACAASTAPRRALVAQKLFRGSGDLRRCDSRERPISRQYGAKYLGPRNDKGTCPELAGRSVDARERERCCIEPLIPSYDPLLLNVQWLS